VTFGDECGSVRRVSGDDQEPGLLLVAAGAHESFGLARQVVGVVQLVSIVGPDLAVLVDLVVSPNSL
jgi:hypothetical protein